MKLFCLPFAGGSKRAYSHWGRLANHSLEVEGIELKGRGERFGQGFYRDITEAVDDIYELIKDSIEKEEYALYGHSMGTLLAYELYYKVIDEGQRKPQHIFFSGRQSPIVKDNMHITSHMPDDEFIARLIALGGIQEELTQSKELMEFYLPVIKNDIRMMENYDFQKKAKNIECGISVLHGIDDTIDGPQEMMWDDLCEKRSKLYYFLGGHFFINDHTDKIMNIIEGELLPNEVDYELANE